MLYCLANARDDGQRDFMREMEREKICVFCPEGFTRTNQNAIHRTAHWTVTPNRFPYRNAGLHMLLVPYNHVADMLELSVAAKADFFSALKWVRDEFALNNYRLMVRNGECTRTGATVAHLHVHVIMESL